MSARVVAPAIREHPAPSGALRLDPLTALVLTAMMSGSTQHHQVH